jgi:hypothetical protein
MSSTQIQLETSGNNKDERIEFAMAATAKAISLFAEAIQKSTGEQEQISFKAFTLATTKDEAKHVFEILMTMVAMELQKQVPDLVKTVTFFHSMESNEAEDTHSLFLHCDKTRTPPSKEELETAAKAKESFSVELVQKAIDDMSDVELSLAMKTVPEAEAAPAIKMEIVEEVQEVVLPHASLMSGFRID